MATELGRREADSTAAERDGILAELTELVELQASKLSELRGEIQALRREREELRTELAMAQGWVRELAGRVEDAEMRLEERRSWTLGARIQTAPAE
jgi:uncharacterized coiled-coil DUF342 family protein